MLSCSLTSTGGSYTLAFDSIQELPLTIQYEVHANYYVHDNAKPKVHLPIFGPLRIQNDEIQWSLHYL
jgi:hypothetical protein